MSDGDSTFGEVFGFIFGLLFLVVLPVIVMVVNVLSLQRRRTNHRCALAVIFVATAWLIAMAGGMMVQSLPRHSMLRAVPFFLCLLLTFASAVLAVIGLIECRRHQRYRCGKRRALLALALDCVFFALILYGLIAGLHHRGFPT
jgi:uncharacterized membrane protein YfcA